MFCFTEYMNMDRRTAEIHFAPGAEYGVLDLENDARIDVTYRPLTGDALRAVLMEALAG